MKTLEIAETSNPKNTRGEEERLTGVALEVSNLSGGIWEEGK